MLVLLLVLFLRVPFLNQAIQGDDVNYFYGAAHAQIDPLHPTHARYVLMGKLVDMRGHPHPPLNTWVLGALVAMLHDVREVPFHAAYIVLSCIAAISALCIARRFSPHALAATVLFLVTPAFVINGTSFESDVPFVAFWLASLALYMTAVDRESLIWLGGAAFVMALAALAAYQTIVLVPILLLYGRKWRPAWIAAMTPLAVLGAWQLYERATSGELPASVLAGYMHSYGLQALIPKLRSAAALTGHLGWVLFPALSACVFWRISRAARVIWLVITIALFFVDRNPLYWVSASVGVLVLVWCSEHYRDFLSGWILIFFGAALVIFFAGSARYLLPLILPVAILASRGMSSRLLYGAAFLELLLSLALAIVNYQHWDDYRQFARSLTPQVESKRTWVNGEWGLRYYLEAEGALPLMLNQTVHPGEIVVSSSLAYPVPYTAGGGMLASIAQRTITSWIPLRLVSLHGHSGYSAAALGLRPFDISTGLIDEVRAEQVLEAKPEREDLPMNAPEAPRQIVSGIYDLEDGKSRWMQSTGVVLLKSPVQPEPLAVSFYIPPQAPARHIRLLVDGQLAAEQTYTETGAHTLTSAPMRANGASALVTITADKAFSIPGDQRELGIILIEVGFKIH